MPDGAGSACPQYWVETLKLNNVPLPADQLCAGVPYRRPVSKSAEGHSAGVLPAVPKIQSHRQAAGEAIYSDDIVPATNALCECQRRHFHDYAKCSKVQLGFLR